MPHLVIEYSRNLETEIDIPVLLGRLHSALAAAGIDQARIKTRGIALSHVVVGNAGEMGRMIHATLSLLEGRDIETKRLYGDPLYALMKHAVEQIGACAVTLEIRDMVRDTYYL